MCVLTVIEILFILTPSACLLRATHNSVNLNTTTILVRLSDRAVVGLVRPNILIWTRSAFHTTNTTISFWCSRSAWITTTINKNAITNSKDTKRGSHLYRPVTYHNTLLEIHRNGLIPHRLPHSQYYNFGLVLAGHKVNYHYQ